MKTINYFLILALFFIFSPVFSQEKEKGVKTVESADQKKYTQAEFDNAVKEKFKFELEKTLKRLGSGSIVDLTNELLKKEEILKTRELVLTKELEQMELAKKDFEKKIKKFQLDQVKVIGCIDVNDKEKDKRVSHMVEVISGMKPQVASDILSVQEPDLSVRILGLLDPSKVSKIFNLMNKEISARLQKQYLDMKR